MTEQDQSEARRRYEELSKEGAQILANPVRFTVFALLSGNNRLRSKDIAKDLDKPANAVAYHLKKLEGAGFIRRAEVEDADGREVWWESVPVDGWTVSAKDPAMNALGKQLMQIQSNSFLEVQMRAQEQGIGQGHPFFTANGGVNLSLEEAEELTDRLTDFIEEIFSRRQQPVDPKDLTYFLSIDWYAQRENSEAARQARTTSSVQIERMEERRATRSQPATRA
ncbi:helix-turn-helix domain-containing protein [Actinomycetaceae bacterium L2_0104]